MSSDLIIDVTPSEIVIALQEDKKLVELTRERSGAKFAVGDIYLGKVKKIIRILIGSRFYFDLSLQERYDLIRYILRKFPFSV